MKLKLFQINAFSDKMFSGNPACVIPLKEWLPDELLLKIAKENAVPETAFFVKKTIKYIYDGLHQKLRWIYADTLHSQLLIV